jgi:microcystin-dependent protein
MSEPFIGEIRMFAGNFAPRNWALCDGQLLAISQNDALFSLLGTIYGGDGRTTFGLPDLRGRLPVHQGNGPGLTPRPIGAKFGSETTSLSQANIPGHSHQALASTAVGSQNNPDDSFLASSPGVRVYRPAPTAASFDPGTIGTAPGTGNAQNNVMPFLCVNFIIALFGIYPSRS